MARDVVLAPSFPLLLHRLVARVCAHHHDDPLVSEIILVPNAPVARFVESALAAASPTPLLNVQVIPIRWAPQRLAPRDAHIPEPPAPLLLECAARRLLRRHVPAMAVLDGAERALMATFTDLLDAGFIDGETVREFGASLSQEGQDRQTLQLYAFWLDLVTDAGLVPAQIASAQSSWPVESRWLHVFGFPRLEGILADMVDRWAHASPELDIAHYFPCHPDAFSGKRFGYDYVAGHVEQAHLHHVSERIRAPVYSSGLFPEIDALLFRDTPGGNAMHDVRLDHVGFIAAAGEAGEVEAAARITAEALADPSHAVRPEDLAVLAPDISTYEPFILSIFSEMDLPVRWLHPVSAGQHPALRWMTTLLKLPELGFPAASVREVLTAPFALYPPPWGQEILPELGANLGEMGAISLATGAWRTRWCGQADAPWAALVCAFVEELEKLVAAHSCDWFVDALQGVLGRWARGEIIGDEAVLGPWMRQCETLRHLDALGFLADEPAGEVALRLCRDALEEVSLSSAQQARGILVGSMSSALGMEFKRVVILGANRGRFPRSPREDPLLSDATRFRITTELGYALPLAADTVRRDRLLFILTLLSAGERAWVTYQHADAQGAAKSPSLLLSLLFGDHAERVVQHHTDRTARLVQIAGEGGIQFTPREAARLMVERGSADEAAALNLPLGPVFAACLCRAQGAAEARERVVDATVHDMRASVASGPLIRALSRIQGWRDLDACPYRFFLGHLLGIPDADSPGAHWQAGARERGDLLHKAMELAFRTEIPHSEGCLRHAEAAWEAAQAWFLHAHRRADLPGLVALELERVASWLFPLLQEEIRLLKSRRDDNGPGFTVHPEVAFSGSVQIDSLDIPLRVRFDRVERHHEHGRAFPLRITDYKLRNDAKNAPLDSHNLQAFLYAQAVASKEEVRPDVEYVEIVPQPLTVKTLPIAGADAAAEALLWKKARLLLRCALAGIWHLRIEQSNCGHCSYLRLCRRHDSLVAGKAAVLRADHDRDLKRLNDDLLALLRPALAPRYPIRSDA